MKLALQITTAIACFSLSALPASPYPAMESPSYVITSLEFSSFGRYKASESYDTWDSGGQPSSIGAWTAQTRTNSGLGWAYTINLPIFWDKDHDKDGMPLSFEQQFAWLGLDDYDQPQDARWDSDGDGFYNIQEYLSKTDPSDPTSFFQFTDIRLVTWATGESNPYLCWWNPTTCILGFESDYPQYPRSLRFDILYADWPVQSQATRQFPNDDWFNQTDTWELLSNATDLYRSASSAMTAFTDTGVGSAMNDGDIRFYRMAIHNTYLEGDPTTDGYPWGYQMVGDPRLASTVSKEILMVQKRVIDPNRYPAFALAGDAPGGNGKFDYVLGMNYFARGNAFNYQTSTHVNLWVRADGSSRPNYSSADFLSQTYGWRSADWSASTRKIVAEDGFRMVFNPQTSPVYPKSFDFYVGSQLKMTSYYHEIYHRDPNPPAPSLDDDDAQITFISYNYPVFARFSGDLDPPFPPLAGTSDPTYPIPGWQGLASDWLIFYDRDLNTTGRFAENYHHVDAIIYYDHSGIGPKKCWKYFNPIYHMGTEVGEELVISSGSPFIVYQYWDPDDPSPWSAFTMGDRLPYQYEESTFTVHTIKSYLKWNQE